MATTVEYQERPSLSTGRSRKPAIRRGRRIGLALLALFALAGAPAPAQAFVYWANITSTGAIGRATLDGTGVNQNYISDTGTPIGVAVDDAHIYWANTFDGTIGRANLNGTGINRNFITGAPNGTQGVAVDDAHIYWANNANGTIGRANLNGTGVNQSFISGLGALYGVAVDDAHIYWANAFNSAIGRANLNGTGVNQSFISGAGDPHGVAVDAAHVYWANTNVAAIGRANLNGTGINRNFITGAANPQGVAVDGAHVYWSNTGAGAIGRANLNGTGVNHSFITGANSPQGVAVDRPGPVLGKAVDVAAVSGTVLVDLPGGGGFVPLQRARTIPVGSKLDTERGTVRLTSARDTRGQTQTGLFGGGVFKVSQQRRAGGLTDLQLTGGRFGICPRSGGGASASRVSKRVIRKLDARARRGRFRTRGRYSASTVRGTVWTTIDRCDGTLTRVRKGTVAVRDLPRKRTVIVHAGQSYLARAPGA